jgi:histidinol-phosphate phosphatase family protein
MSRRAVFLDRDGVINVEGGDYIDRPEDLHVLPGALEAIAALSRRGWPVVVFTNQSGVGRGFMTAGALESIHAYLRCEVARAGGELTAVYACTHMPDAGCDCRKPRPGMLIEAAREHDLDLPRSFAVGDSPRDIAAAKSAGATAVLVLSGHTSRYDPADFPAPQPDYVFPDLAAFAAWLLEQGTEG